MKLKSEFLKEINSRGFIYQSSDLESLDSLISKKKITGYIGFDITSDSLHIGSLVQLMLLYWLNHFGHKPIALVGGGTTLIGDPSGKDSTRQILKKKEIDKNILKVQEKIEKALGLKVNILNKKNNSGKISIEYKDLDQFELVSDKLIKN